MADKLANPDRQITVAGRSYTLRYSLRAMMALQDHYQLPSLDAVGKRMSDASQLAAGDLVAVLWAGLRTHHPDIGWDDALGILDDAGLGAMEQVIGEAFAAAFPDDAADAEDAAPHPPEPGRSTG